MDLSSGGVVNIIDLIDLLESALKEQPKIARKIIPNLYSDSFYAISDQDKLVLTKYTFAVTKLCYAIEKMGMSLRELFRELDAGEKGYCNYII